MPSATPKVSVILPTYQRGAVIRRALHSVLAQTFGDLEVIVLDDAPADETEAVCRSFNDARVRYVPYPSRRGVAAARNQGIELARGEFIAFQDSDDEWLLDKLEHQLARLQSLPPDVAVTQGAIVRYEGGNARYLFSGLQAGTERTAILACNNTTFLQAWLARKSVLVEAGVFDSRLQLWEDWELLIRICQKFPVDMDPRVMAIIYDTPDSLIKQSHRRVESLDIIVTKHAALMSAEPRALAINLYGIGRFQLLDGRTAEGRKLLWRSLLLNPARLRTWAMLALSLLGTSLIRNLVVWRDATRQSPGVG